MTFEIAVKHILRSEGGLVHDKNDPGGLTNFGISQRSYPSIDIANLTKEQAIQIYRKDYWEPCFCDRLPQTLKLVVFDCAVNQGKSFAIKTLQLCVNVVQDGVMGPKTIAAFLIHDDQELLMSYLSERMVGYTKAFKFQTYAKGWINRLMRIAVISAKTCV